MADFLSYLAILESDPDDTAALQGLAAVAPAALAEHNGTQGGTHAGALAATRKTARDRGRPDVVLALLDLELRAVPQGAETKSRRADLLLEKAQLLEDELLDEPAAVSALNEVLSLRDDETALELLEQIEMVRANWQKVVAKYVEEASSATDR
jgi:hypothetical protein